VDKCAHELSGMTDSGIFQQRSRPGLQAKRSMIRRTSASEELDIKLGERMIQRDSFSPPACTSRARIMIKRRVLTVIIFTSLPCSIERQPSPWLRFMLFRGGSPSQSDSTDSMTIFFLGIILLIVFFVLGFLSFKLFGVVYQ